MKKHNKTNKTESAKKQQVVKSGGSQDLHRFPRTVFQRAVRTFLPADVTLPSELRGDIWGAFQRKEVRDFIVRMCAASAPDVQANPMSNNGVMG